MSESWKSWQEMAQKEAKKDDIEIYRLSPESIPIKRLYVKESLSKEAKDEYPGQAPYKRGPKATMYTGRPWTIRQYAGFSTAEESNKFYKDALSKGQKGLSVAFDLPTHRGYDSDHPRVKGDVGKAGVAIDSVEDMKILFSQIPLDQMSVSMTMNGAVLPILASYVVAAQEQGVSSQKLKGTIQNDILKEYMVRNTYIYPPAPSMRIVTDIMHYTTHNMPLFNSISVSGYHLQEAGADSALELAYTIANALEYVRAAIASGLKVDDFAPRMSFFFAIGMNFFMEIAKLRAARVLWYEMMKEFNPKNPKSSILRTHCQTSGYSLTEKSPYNNIVRTTIEAMAGALGGTQSLHTNAFDEAIALPSLESSRIARDTQLILQKETDINHTVDPLGGSYFVESLTSELIKKAKSIIKEIDDCGGMVNAINAGIPKLRIEESSARKQARIDGKEEIIVGVNDFVDAKNNQDFFDVRVIDNEKVYRLQKAKIEKLRKERDTKRVQSCLKKIKTSAADKSQNLFVTVLEAMKARATVGEVSETIASVFGRYHSPIQSISRVYMENMSEDQSFKKAVENLNSFIISTGRRPRILIAKIGQDGHDRGAKVIATGLADIGFDIDIGPLFQTPQEVAKQAVENDVHMVGISSLAAGHRTLIPELISALKQVKCEDIAVSIGGVIPQKDYKFLLDAGVATIFKPGTSIPECALQILDVLNQKS
ncbi:MAG: methylmalonyl-CoA mutase [Zetaproteobacteria bacterium]|nr:methylmalonyl-CoA mutase [Pseudobdellovibrionaceae bacterium]